MAANANDIMLDEPENQPAIEPELLDPELQDSAAGVTDAAAAPPEPKADPEIKQIRKEMRRLEKRTREAEDNAKAWYDRASQTAAPAPPEPPQADDDEDEVDLVEAISANDHKALRKGLKQLGFVAKDEVEQAINSRVNERIATERQSMTRDAELTGMFPDLTDSRSPLFEATARIYREMDDLGSSPRRMKSAALEAAAELDIRPERGDSRRAPPPDHYETDDDSDDDEDERDRQTRVRSQSSPKRGRRPPAATDDNMSPLQKEIARKMGVSEEAYSKRAKRGISLSGLPR